MSRPPAPFGLDERLWEILVCPGPDHGELAVDEAAHQLVCTACAARFDVRDGLPIMLLSESQD
jgi:uncharacterized protein YbaR (Trm112 family)